MPSGEIRGSIPAVEAQFKILSTLAYFEYPECWAEDTKRRFISVHLHGACLTETVLIAIAANRTCHRDEKCDNERGRSILLVTSSFRPLTVKWPDRNGPFDGSDL